MKRLIMILVLAPALALAQAIPPDDPKAAYDGGSVTNPFLAPSGTFNLPGYGWQADGDSGIFWVTSFLGSGQDGMAFTIDDTQPLTIRDDGAGAGIVHIFDEIRIHSGGFVSGVTLTADNNQVLAQRRTSSPQEFRIYNTFTDSTNYERASFKWDTNVFEINVEEGGTGTVRTLQFQIDDADIMRIQSNGVFMDASIIPDSGGSYDLGQGNNDFRAVAVNTAYVDVSTQDSTSTALTDATATAFARIAIAQTIGSNYEAGQVIYSIYCDDSTNQAIQQGAVAYACHNLAGTETCGFSVPAGVTNSDGTADLATPVFDAAAGTDTVDLRVDSDCTGITPTTHTIQWRLDMPTTATVTPQ